MNIREDSVLGGSIDDFVADSIISQLLLLDAQDHTKDIRLFINPSGGSLGLWVEILWSCFKCGNDVACRSFGNMSECSFCRLHGRFCKSLTQMQILRFLKNSLQHPQTGFLWPLMEILVVRELIPHKKFPFSKIWLLSAQLEIRLLNLKGARAILGEAIGRAPKDKIELQLGNIDRCRKLYEKYLEWSPENCYAWSKYAELEKSLAQAERARALFELAIKQSLLDMPELLWKAYIDFEISEEEFDNTRELYENLLNRTKHVKVWISYAKFEASAMEGSDDDPEKRKTALNVLERELVSAFVKHVLRCVE